MRKRDRPTDGPTDVPTDGRTDTPTYRVASSRLKTRNEFPAVIELGDDWTGQTMEICRSRCEGRSDDMVLLRLIETHCVPILTYGMENAHVVDPDERRSLRVAYNVVSRDEAVFYVYFFFIPTEGFL